jgi:Universal stress protein family
VDIAQKYGSQLFVLHVFQGGTGAGTLVSSSDEADNRSIGQEVLNSYEETAKERGVQNVRMLLEMGDAAKRIVETASEVKCGLLLLWEVEAEEASRNRCLEVLATR